MLDGDVSDRPATALSTVSTHMVEGILLRGDLVDQRAFGPARGGIAPYCYAMLLSSRPNAPLLASKPRKQPRLVVGQPGSGPDVRTAGEPLSTPELHKVSHSLALRLSKFGQRKSLSVSYRFAKCSCAVGAVPHRAEDRFFTKSRVSGKSRHGNEVPAVV